MFKGTLFHVAIFMGNPMFFLEALHYPKICSFEADIFLSFIGMDSWIA